MKWTFLSLFLGLACSCSSSLSSTRLENHESYLVKDPVTRHFTYERVLDGESWVRGTLTIAVEEITWPADTMATYRMSGTIQSTSRGHYATRSAAQGAPIAELKAAMDPANIDEVFEVIESSPGVLITQPHWDRLGALRLPIEATSDSPASAFSSSLMKGSWNAAVELAMVWHKTLIMFLHVPPFGEFSLTAIEEDADGVTLSMTQSLGSGDPVRYEYHLSRDGLGMTGLVVHHRDGTVTTVK
jgi:hypothetical protein